MHRFTIHVDSDNLWMLVKIQAVKESKTLNQFLLSVIRAYLTNAQAKNGGKPDNVTAS